MATSSQTVHVITRGYRFSEFYGLWDIYITIVHGYFHGLYEAQLGKTEMGIPKGWLISEWYFSRVNLKVKLNIDVNDYPLVMSK